ncbi:hypothetical protein K438DRAFT_2097636 [Mycena galopus ATCC 62051]|nr:hypothetical protein K438DRAFT_2097636 [Mycena galopus ATCC 62051]
MSALIKARTSTKLPGEDEEALRLGDEKCAGVRKSNAVGRAHRVSAVRGRRKKEKKTGEGRAHLPIDVGRRGRRVRAVMANLNADRRRESRRNPTPAQGRWRQKLKNKNSEVGWERRAWTERKLRKKPAMCESGKWETGKKDRRRTGFPKEDGDRINGWSAGTGKEGSGKGKWGEGKAERMKGKAARAQLPRVRSTPSITKWNEGCTTGRHARRPGKFTPVRGSPNKSAERRHTGEAKRVTAAVVDADEVALGQDRPQPLVGPIVESYTSAATLTVEATEKVASGAELWNFWRNSSVALYSSSSCETRRARARQGAPWLAEVSMGRVRCGSCPGIMNQEKGVQLLSIARRMHVHAELASTSRQDTRRAVCAFFGKHTPREQAAAFFSHGSRNGEKKRKKGG